MIYVCMSCKTNSPTILVAIAAITLALVTAASFTHYSALAVSKKDSSSSNTKGTSSTSTNPKSVSSKELKSFISCVTTANNSQGLTHKIVTGCLDTAKGIPPAAPGTTAGAATSGSSASSTTG